MIATDFFPIITNVSGLFSGVMFAWGTMRMTQTNIYEQSILRYSGINREVADSLVRQKADYFVGSTFLIITFCLQIVQSVQPRLPYEIEWFHVAGVLAIVFGIGFLRAHIIKRFHESMRKLETEERG